MLEAGATNRDIAAKIGVGDRTVESHVSQILRKFGTTTRGDVIRQRAPETGLGSLTWRELEVLCLVTRGSPQRDIADQLNIDARTLQTHVYNIRKKLRVPGNRRLDRFGMDG